MDDIERRSLREWRQREIVSASRETWSGLMSSACVDYLDRVLVWDARARKARKQRG